MNALDSLNKQVNTSTHCLHQSIFTEKTWPEIHLGSFYTCGTTFKKAGKEMKHFWGM